MKYLSYTWTIITNIIVLIIINAIYESTYNQSEIITYSLLILIYITITSYFSMHFYLKTEEFFSLNNEFRKIRNLIEYNDEENIEEKEIIEEKQKEWSKNKTKYWINNVFNFIIFIIVVIKLIDAL